VIQLWCRCAAEVNNQLQRPNRAIGNQYANDHLVLRARARSSACRLRHSFHKIQVPIRAMPSGALGPSHAARNIFASFGATMRLSR